VNPPEAEDDDLLGGSESEGGAGSDDADEMEEHLRMLTSGATVTLSDELGSIGSA